MGAWHVVTHHGSGRSGSAFLIKVTCCTLSNRLNVACSVECAVLLLGEDEKNREGVLHTILTFLHPCAHSPCERSPEPNAEEPQTWTDA